MSTFVWPNDEGWPYPDALVEVVDLESEGDDDLLAVRTEAAHLLAGLDPLEREVVAARFGLAGHLERTMVEMETDTGRSRQDLDAALGSGLAKLRLHLSV